MFSSITALTGYGGLLLVGLGKCVMGKVDRERATARVLGLMREMGDNKKERGKKKKKKV